MQINSLKTQVTNEQYDSSLPQPFSEKWREAYRATENDTPRLSSYQAPDKKPVSFILDSLGINGGQSVDTAEFPFFGYWSNNSLNEKVQQIMIRGRVIGENYIAFRNELITSLQIKTNDDTPGYLELPLWGRFAVVVSTWDVQETTANGQCQLSLDFVRVGWSDTNRLQHAQTIIQTQNIDAILEELETVSIAEFSETLSVNCDNDMLVTGFSQLTETLTQITGRVQGAKSKLNEMVSKISQISNLIAQGVRTPALLAQAAFNAVAGIITGLAEIKNAAEETVAYFMRTNNTKNALTMFLSVKKVTITDAAITASQIHTKQTMVNFSRILSYYASAALFSKLIGEKSTYQKITYQKATELWKQFEKLEQSLTLETPEVFTAVDNLRLTLSQTMIQENLSVELSRSIVTPIPLLVLSHTLSCDDVKLRTLNTIPDSFNLVGKVTYV